MRRTTRPAARSDSSLRVNWWTCKPYCPLPWFGAARPEAYW